MTWRFSDRSMRSLAGVHPDLVAVLARGLSKSTVDFGVTEGLRTMHRQKRLVQAGASMTTDSRHLTGHAADVVAYLDGDVSWDWPLYHEIARACKEAAKEMGVKIRWGGDWERFPDGPHFELDREDYPGKAWTGSSVTTS